MRARKEERRAAARAARRALAPEARAAKDARIRDTVLALPEARAARVVGAYVSVHSEVDTRRLLADLLEADVRVGVPVVVGEGEMRLAELSSLDDLRPGAFGIPEPSGPRRFLDAVDALLVPGLQFSTDGHRLGYGGGYFDRLLARMPAAFRVGLAYEEQVVPRVPSEAHDETLDALVTDAAVRRFPRAR